MLTSTAYVSVGDQHPLLVTVSGGRTPSQTVRVRGAEAEGTANLMCEGAHFQVQAIALVCCWLLELGPVIVMKPFCLDQH